MMRRRLQGLRLARLWMAVLLIAAAAASAMAQVPLVVEYYHVDAVGSVRAVTNQSGTVIRAYDFSPFGELESTQCTQSEDPRLYTGQERDKETCLDYFGARYYRSTSGRFLTVDPAMDTQKASLDPQQWNRYAYARNNPTTFIDPDGREIAVRYRGQYVGVGLETVAPSTSNGNREFAILAGIAGGAVLAPVALQAGVNLCLMNPIACISGATGMLERFAGAPPGASGLAFHHTFDKAAASILSSGLNPGSYATPVRGLTAMQAQLELSLNPARGMTNTVLQVDIQGLRGAGYTIPEATRVRGWFGMPGGGYEMQFPYHIPAGFVSRPPP